MVRTIIANMKAKPAAVEKLKAKLLEAADVYVKDQGTLSWTILQDPKVELVTTMQLNVQDKTKFAIIERYENAAAVGIHAKNPYFKEFGLYIRPLLDQPAGIGFYDELKDTKAKL